LTLSGANLYTGGTEVTGGGTLLVANTEGSATGTGNLTVTNGSRLGGTGSIAGNVTVYANSYLDLQNNQCKSITINKNLMLNSNANIVLEVNPLTSLSDAVNAVDVSINGNLEIVKLGNGTFQAGMTFKIFNASGTITGTFAQITASLPDGLAWSQSRLAEGILTVETTTGLSSVEMERKTVKAVEYYNLLGITVPEDARGFVLKKIVYNDNAIVIEKTFKK
jgi:hypothetical protein